MNPDKPFGGVLSGHARPADPRAVVRELLHLASSERTVAYSLTTADQLPSPTPESRRPGPRRPGG